MEQQFKFTLYSDNRLFRGWWKNDVRALTKLCQKFAGTRYSIEILQMSDDPQRAFRDGVFRAPSILLETPGGRKQNLGGFAEAEDFLTSLGAARGFEPLPAKSSMELMLLSLQKLAA